MIDDADSYRVVRLNERVRLFSGAAGNLGTALTAATAYRLFVEGKQDGTAVLWIAGVLALMSFAFRLLGLVEPEK